MFFKILGKFLFFWIEKYYFNCFYFFRIIYFLFKVNKEIIYMNRIKFNLG